MTFSAGDDGDEVTFMAARVFKHSESSVERRIYRYDSIARAMVG